MQLKSLSACQLYTFVDTAYLGGRSPAELTRALCDGGADLIQLRAKGVPLDEVARIAERVAPIAEAAGVWFVVNDYPQVAAAVGAPLCHLGQEDFFGVGHVRVDEVCAAAGGPGLGLGLSSHAPDQAQLAVNAGAAYVAVGPVFATPTKPGRPGVSLDYVRWAASHLQLPWFAIGGIHLDNLDQVLAAGATRVAVVSAILLAPDVTGACLRFRARLSSARPPESG
jgi:thiamine-phosphate pyrophosphorylase